MITHDYKTQHSNRDALAVFLVAIIGRLPSLGAWWHGSDWELLARAAGVVPGEGFAAHWLGRDVLWSLMWPMAGLEPDPWTWLRLLLHGFVALLTVRLAIRLGYAPWARLLAGLLVAVTPLAFQPLLNAQGIETLLAAALGLLAIERGLAQGASSTVVAALAAVGAILAGDAALGLPALVIWWGVDRTHRDLDARSALALGVALLILTGIAIALMARQLAPVGGWAEEIAPIGIILTNLARAPLWMLSPLPYHPEPSNPIIALAGFSVWVLWAVHARRSTHDGDRRPGILLIAAIVALAPSLPWRTLGTPASCYLTWVPTALALSSVLTARKIRGPKLPVFAVTIAIAVGIVLGSTTFGLKQRRNDGQPANSVVRATAISFEASNRLRNLPETIRQVVILQPGRIIDTPLRMALDVPHGTRMILPDGPAVRWTDHLDDLIPRDYVMIDEGTRLKSWGNPTQARLLLVLTRIGQNRQDEAVELLYRTLAGSRLTVPFFFSEDQLTVSPSRVRDHVPVFLEAVDHFAMPVGDNTNLRTVAVEFLRRADLYHE